MTRPSTWIRGIAASLFFCAIFSGCGGGGDNQPGGPGVEVTGITPNVFLVSGASIPFILDGSWANVGEEEIQVRFRAVSGTPFRSPAGARLDALELLATMNGQRQIRGEIPPWAVAEEATSYVEVQFGDGEPVITTEPLGAFVVQQEIPAPADAGLYSFGQSVATSGDTLVVGSWRDGSTPVPHGTAYVYVRTGATWTFQDRLEPVGGGAQDKFGWSVDVDGDTAIVGAFYAEGAVATGGAAYVFVRSGSTWTEQAKLIPPDGQALHEFGFSVAVDGDTAVVGAPGDDDLDPGAGSVYVFVRSGSTWAFQQELHASSGGLGEWFGRSVEIDGDTILASAPHADTMASNGGAGFVFVRSGTAWTEQQELTSSDGQASDALGWSIGLSGDRIVLGSTRSGAAGGAYHFERTGGIWTEEQKILPPRAGPASRSARWSPSMANGWRWG